MKTKIDYNSIENQEIKSKFVQREVLTCFSYEMGEILGLESNFENRGLPTWDDVANSFEEICPKCGSDEIYKAKEEEPNGDCFQCGCCHVVLENNRLESQPKEIFEWWIVTEYLYKQLKEKGEPVLEWGNNYYWGRCTTGQAIMLDHVIGKICEEMEILDGQKYSWAK